MESQPRNPEFRNDPKNFHPCTISSVDLDLSFFKNSVDPDQMASSEVI